MSDDECSGDGGEMSRHREAPSAKPVDADGGGTRLDEIFEALTHRTRRFILYHLQDHEVVTVDELARAVAAWEAEIPPAEVSTAHRERVATTLAHTHLPKLADALFIEYDQRSSTIRFTEPPLLLDKVLHLLAKFEEEAGS